MFQRISLSILDVRGADAAVILSNLTTNDIRSVSIRDESRGVESFVTNVKGKCVGHVMVFALEDGFRLIGAPGQSEAIVEHLDRYTIREDAVPTILDDQFSVVIDGGESQYAVPWLGDEGVGIRLLPLDSKDAPSVDSDEESAFHRRRIAAGFPWFGIDFDSSNLPQEANRDSTALSFTKGCYLGQETVARLDALGQVQKQLVQWNLSNLPDNTLPAADTKLFASREIAAEGGKPVGRLTSVAGGELVVAIGMARRSHFDIGATAVGQVGDVWFDAIVAGPDS